MACAGGVSGDTGPEPAGSFGSHTSKSIQDKIKHEII